MCNKKTAITQLVMRDTGEKVESEIINKKNDLDIKQANIVAKADCCRKTLSELIKSGDKAKAADLKLQINELERYSCTTLEDIKTMLNTVFREVQSGTDLEEEKFIKGSRAVRPSIGDGDAPSPESSKNVFENKRSQRRARISQVVSVDNSDNAFSAYLDSDSPELKRRNSESNKVEIVIPEETDEHKGSDEDEESIEGLEAQRCDSSDDSLIYHDALDHMIYDELEKEVSKNRKRRSSNHLEENKRTTLPALKPSSSINIFKILKDSIGKDLSKFCVPVYFNEPLSMLQKIAEIFQNENLLATAAEQEDSLLRLVYVTAFCIAQYGGTQSRCSKPFNPVLGETFELKTPTWKFLAEQVSHHPPISAGYLQHEKYECWMNTHMKTKFWGKSLEFKPLGNIHYKFKDNQDHFVCQRPVSSVNNIILGTMYISHSGDSRVTNTRTGDRAIIDFKVPGMFAGKGKRGAVEAVIEDAKGTPAYIISGKWTESVGYKKAGEPDSKLKTIWEFPPIPENWESIYHFTEFTLQLNNSTERMRQLLPPTDSRNRPDQRYLETGDLNLANAEKIRLEEKQRRRRKRMEKEYVEYKVKYFVKEKDEHSEGEEFINYRYIGDYWKDRAEQNWHNMPDLFGPDTPEGSFEESKS